MTTDQRCRRSAKITRTIRNLELVDEPDQDFIRDITERRAELRAHKQQFQTHLAEVEQRILHAPNPELIDALPITKIQLDELPAELARALGTGRAGTTSHQPGSPAGLAGGHRHRRPTPHPLRRAR